MTEDEARTKWCPMRLADHDMDWLENTRCIGSDCMMWRSAAAIDDRSISALELTVRTENCLRAENIKTVKELAFISDAQLLKMPNMGRKSLREIRFALSDFALPNTDSGYCGLAGKP